MGDSNTTHINEDSNTEYMFVLSEFIDVIVMTIAVGFIFKDFFHRPRKENYDPLKAVGESKHKTFLHDIGYSIIITAPAVIFHELAHKLVAISFGMSATFHAAYKFLALGILLKLFHVPFLFFVPGYVSHPNVGPIQTMAIAFADKASMDLDIAKSMHRDVKDDVEYTEYNRYLGTDLYLG